MSSEQPLADVYNPHRAMRGQRGRISQRAIPDCGRSGKDVQNPEGRLSISSHAS